MKALLLGLLSVSAIFADNFEIRPAEAARLALTVEKTGLYRGKKHLFLFREYQGRLEFDPQKPEASKIQLNIDSRSLICKDDWLSADDLKNVQEVALNDMLAAQRYPEMTFSGQSIKAVGADRFEVQGVLTIRGIAKPVLVQVQLQSTGPEALRLEGSAVVKLKDYNLKPPSALLGLIGTKNEMTLDFTVIATKSI